MKINIKTMASNTDGPWILARDFNDIVCFEDQSGASNDYYRRARNFHIQIESFKLID